MASPRIKRMICARSRRDSTSVALSSPTRRRRTPSAHRESALGNASGMRIARGSSRADPFTTTPHRPPMPTTVSGAARGQAQPLAHPDRCTIGASAPAIVAFARLGASERVEISPAAQIGAPAQATIWRRGSSARTMKPSRCAMSARRPARSAVTPRTRSARPGAVRRPIAPKSAAARISSSSAVACA